MMQSAYGDQCCDWFKRLKDGQDSVDDDSRSGRPSTSIDGTHVTKGNEIERSNRLFEKSRKIVTLRLVYVVKSW